MENQVMSWIVGVALAVPFLLSPKLTRALKALIAAPLVITALVFLHAHVTEWSEIVALLALIVSLLTIPASIWWYRRQATSRVGRVAKALILGPLILIGAFLLSALFLQRLGVPL